jgi:hypothetical protein
MARYVVSVVICHCILVYELAVIRVYCENGLDSYSRLSNTAIISESENRLRLVFEFE